MSYAVPVLRLPARLVDFQGRERAVTFFVHPLGECDEGRLGERLNDPAARFVPCESGDGGVELVQLSWIAYVELAGVLPEVEEKAEIGAARRAVALELVSGEVLEGDLLYEAPPGHDRVSDLLNSPGPPFLLLASGPTTRYVQRGAILRVRS